MTNTVKYSTRATEHRSLADLGAGSEVETVSDAASAARSFATGSGDAV